MDARFEIFRKDHITSNPAKLTVAKDRVILKLSADVSD